MHGRRPFDPGRFPFYYGWVILVVGTVGMLASVPGQTAGVSVFTDDLTAATSLSRLQLSTAYLIGTTTSGLLLPIGGRWIDIVGARVVAFGATLGLAATITMLSLVGPMGSAMGLFVMSVGFGCVRFSGQGLLTLASRTMISQWFERSRGLVTSVSAALASFMFALAPRLLFALVEGSGFRLAWRQLALGLVVGVGAMVLLLFRNRPEDAGLLIDGDGTLEEADTITTTGPGGLLEGDLAVTRAEALRDAGFWIITLPVAALSMVGTAITFHIIDLGREMGMSEEQAVGIFVAIASISIPVSLVGGWLVDRLSPLRLAVAMAVAQIIMYAGVASMDNTTIRVIAIVGWGFSQGMFSPLTSAALPRLFGRTHLGSIAGVNMSAMVIGSALGPAFFAAIQSSLGSYQQALWLSMSLPTAVLALTFWAVSTGRAQL